MTRESRVIVYSEGAFHDQPTPGQAAIGHAGMGSSADQGWLDREDRARALPRGRRRAGQREVGIVVIGGRHVSLPLAQWSIKEPAW